MQLYQHLIVICSQIILMITFIHVSSQSGHGQKISEDYEKYSGDDYGMNSGSYPEQKSDMMEKNKNYLRLKNTLPAEDGLPIIIHVHLSLERSVKNHILEQR